MCMYSAAVKTLHCSTGTLNSEQYSLINTQVSGVCQGLTPLAFSLEYVVVISVADSDPSFW